MSVAEYFIKNKVISWMFTLILLLGGTFSYLGLGQLEDPEFTIKDALVITSYPGATPLQVEEEVSYLIEKQILTLPYVDEIKSINSRGLSQITVTMKNQYGAEELPQIWDELRRKVNDLSPQLPPGVGTPRVIDDFGDVYGIMWAVTGEGFAYNDLKDYVDFLKRDIELVDGVSKVSIAGEQQEVVYIEVSANKMASLGISPDTIYSLLTSQNTVQAAGAIHGGTEYIYVHPTGEYSSVKALEDLLITSSGSNKLIYLKDVATVSKGYKEVPDNLINFDGKQAINVAISFASGVNVVKVGEAIDKRLAQLEQFRPAGINIGVIYDQPKEVDKSVGAFVLNLVEAVAIVVVVLLVFMGLKSGLLIGLILLLTVLGTFLFMKWFAIDLQRISLGALIIALGMLVDNAIVVVEGILIGQSKGQKKLEAAKAIVGQTIWPLLGATVIAIVAFAPIGLSPDATGEFAGTLFWVLFISLFISWITAITLTPFFAHLLFKETPEQNGDKKEAQADPYQGAFFTFYKGLLDICLRFKALTMLVVIGLFVLSVWGYGLVKQAFFPPSTTPIFLIDLWMPQGTDIRDTAAISDIIEQELLTYEQVEHVTATVGKGAQRFMLTYDAERSYAAYAQLLVRVKNSEVIVPTMELAQTYVDGNHPQLMTKFKRLEIGPSPSAKVEAEFTGPDADVLRQLAAQAIDVFHQAGGTVNVRHNWRERTKVFQPHFNETQARRLGITRQDVDDMLQMNLSGLTIGLYREGTSLLPIITRLSASERESAVESLRIWSPIYQQLIPIRQVIDDAVIIWEDPLIQRRDRKRMITVMMDPDFKTGETATSLRNRVIRQIEAIDLPVGYALSWGGEYADSSEASSAIFSSLPMGYLVMFLITVFLFNAVKKPLVIWACVPLALIGIVAGLLILKKPFGFMALLGMLSLSGMLLKNGIVLLDQINIEMHKGLEPYEAVFISAVSRVRPVCMAAITTILGMLPLLLDAFFESMAAVVMFGLGVATILTLIVVPVLFCLFHGVKYRPLAEFNSV
ncbi:efflux RND transporter permease subunit [Thalassomonas actiniarum]|uniref:Efflux RND transporter permease subunit n=1 Tax=Thalassomonas actiniarum TaxID=485447 RepID=A0AAE9YIG7_9GAMM|nr:efflux RND transporter permease subunit [Thalassomonas actiniarum]WDD96690.1 efflux RND transporter permease subunit [Thalassomonas actiniarum]